MDSPSDSWSEVAGGQTSWSVVGDDNTPWSVVGDGHTPDSVTINAQTEQDASKSRLTYGGFIFMLQNLGIHPHSVRAYRFGIPIGKGSYFAVYRQRVRPTDFQALDLVVSVPGEPLFRRRFPDPNDYVAIKRVRVRDETVQIDISDQGQLSAICREIQALVHPSLRDHDGIVKLQAIIWENGLGAGNESGIPMWPALVMEYCETTLAEYQRSHPPLPAFQKSFIGSKIGEGLDAVHSANIFHGDLKSENILIKIGEGGQLLPKLADFGCSVIIRDDKGKIKYWVGGTELWRAPECPNYFTTTEQVAATDWYSFGLLLLRVQLDGKNPFEGLGVIPNDWTQKEKLSAIQFLKDTDCISALLIEASTLAPSDSATRMLASMLLKDPAERMNAMESNFEDLKALVPDTLQLYQDAPDTNLHRDTMNKLSEVFQNIELEQEAPETSSVQEGGFDAIDPFSFISYLRTTSFIPDCAALSKIPRSGALNAATRSRLVNELLLCLNEDSNHAYPKKCEGCCTLSFIDMPGLDLTPDALISGLQQNLEQNLNTHTCRAMLGSDVSMDDLSISTALYGGGVSSVTVQKYSAVLQLFHATATGFGTRKDSHRALKILEEAFTSGLTDACFYLCLYANYTKQSIDPLIPVRKWLVFLVLFSAGVPSDAFLALTQIAPELAEVTARARAKVYNGSTASFGNVVFNSLDIRSLGLGVQPGFIRHASGSLIVQDEVFENSLLHLVAGSDNENTSLIEYCIKTLRIDKDLRNEGGITPLLMACRAGREKKILALLENGVDVNLKYPGGETPLHWLGLLPDPSLVLKEFIIRGADIHAQVFEPQILPNYIGGAKKFFVKGTPLFWAIAMGSEKFVDALLRQGVNMHLPCPITAVSYACRPGNLKSLTRLSQDETFHVTRDDAHCVLTQWTPMDMLAKYVEPKEQEEALELILSSAIPFGNVTDVEDFYRFLVPRAVSECKAEIVEIILRGLSLSIATLPNPDAKLEKYAISPLAHPNWVQYRLVHEATRTGDSEVLRSVLRWGGEASSIDGFNRTTLHTLSFYTNNAECVDILMSHGALSILGNRLEIEGMTAFSNAVACGNFDVADRLLSYTSFDDRLLLLSKHPSGMYFSNLSLMGHFIAWSSDLGEKPIEYLLNLLEVKDNPDLVFVVDEVNKTSALMMACGIKSETSIYDTETFIASRRKRTIDILLKKFPEKRHLDWVDNNNNTALHFAAFLGCWDMATALIAAGGDLSLVNNLGFTPLDLLFMENPEYLSHDLGAKRMMLEVFHAGRNSICMELRSKGAKHHHPLAVSSGWANHLPRPVAKNPTH